MMSQAGSKSQSRYRTVPQQEDRVYSYLTGHKGWPCVLPTGSQFASSSVFLGAKLWGEGMGSKGMAPSSGH